jgi:hypothetical protein
MAAKLAAGVYRNLKDSTYHSDCAEVPSFSSSDFKALALECPAHFYEGHWLNNEYARPDSAALSFGRAAHHMMLGEKYFDEKFAISPFAEFRTDESKGWRDVIAAGKTVIKPKELETVNAMCAALRSTPMTARAFSDGEAELTLIWKPSQGVWPKELPPIMFKSRPDWTPNTRDGSHPALEYKTAESAHPDDWQRAFFEYGYDVQAAVLDEGLRRAFGVTIPVGHVVQEKSKPYITQVYICSEKHLEIGRARLKRGIKLLAECLPAHLSGKPRDEAWPGYFTKPVQFGIPAWIENKESGK